jgi:hypothetical protein
MGMPVLILGESGSGKTSSLRNFDRKDVLVFSVSGKRMPFRKKMNVINVRDQSPAERYDTIIDMMGKYQDKVKTFVIDDSQYLMAFEEMDRVYEKGYGKFTELAKHFLDLISAIKSLNDNVIVYLLHHAQETDSGKVKAKTIGKMIDDHITLEGLFEIVLMAVHDEGGYHFITNGIINTSAKSPIDMFEQGIVDNDLKMVNEKIREYYEISLDKGETVNEKN